MSKSARIFYFSLTDEMRKQEKLDWFEQTPFAQVPFERIQPDEKANWINLTDNDFDSLMPVCSKDVKNGKGGNAIFSLFANSIKTNRDEWVYDFSKENLENKINRYYRLGNKDREKNVSL